MSSERSDTPTDGPRRRRSPFAVASVAAAVLLAGGGGAYFASTAAGNGGDDGRNGAPGAAGNPPPLALGGHTDGSGKGDIAPGEPDPNGVVYRAEGKLPDGPASASVYRTKGEVTAAEVTRLAAALGVTGKPRLEGDVWKAGVVRDSSGPVLQVNRQAPGTWTFLKYAAGGSDNCVTGKDTCGATTVPPGDAGSAVSEKAAKAAAAPVLKAVGQDDAKLDARQLMGAVRVVNASPVVGGLPTYGWTTGVQIGPDGQVVGGSGQLETPVKGDTYPVVDADEALDRLNKAGEGAGPIGIGGCATPVPLDEPTPQGEIAAPCEPSGGAGKPETVIVEKAVFGLAAQLVDGQQALVPSWLFEVRGNNGAAEFTITHPAVDPKYLTSPTADPPATTLPAPAPEDSTPPPVTRSSPIESYSVDGRTLTLTFWGSVCSDYSAQATESASAVTVKILEAEKGKDRVCIMLAKELTETVTLDKPLGDRKVVNGATGEPVPPTRK
ncbi:hypothetical protein NLX86_04525 [Streptomyces sp. A3M-1-3]|uniref:hypothetical protein n=1 Tax=Streptomyces sp. A3M-1-3 TaxID=2962044 RepID=UPI0020B7D08C|nr:hypothetical protein [Streptomyces sp. A3M-1-3]MCP3817429.1 hypothetical protein [Streptomyces sp. A3M-1-3]